MYKRTNRKSDELRTTEVIKDYIIHPDGSVLIATGKTKVLCTAMVEESVPRFLEDDNQGWITSEYSMLPGSTQRRNRRERSKSNISGRTQEIQRLIGRSLRAVVDLKSLGKRTIWIDCDVIQADGGTRTASITGGFIAMYLAIQKLLKEGVIEKDPVKDYVAATSVGLVGDEILLDLCYEEDFNADVDMNIVMTGEKKFVEIQGTAEGQSFSRRQMDRIIDLAEKGILELIKQQKKILE